MLSIDECKKILEGTQVNMNNIKKIFPCPGGGLNLNTLTVLFDFYKNDVIYLIGGGLFRYNKNIIDSCKYFRELVENTDK